jgi:phosphoribosylanthranilate isomerase
VEQAREIVSVLPPFVSVVGLFVDPSPKEVAAVLHKVHLDLLQFHGMEPPEECNCYGKPYIKAIHMREGVDLIKEKTRYASARGLLLDTYKPSVPGGTGEKFDWSVIPWEIKNRIILAGGLSAENVWKAISTVNPFAVDVSSGVELDYGIKDLEKMIAFMRGVNSV